MSLKDLFKTDSNTALADEKTCRYCGKKIPGLWKERGMVRSRDRSNRVDCESGQGSLDTYHTKCWKLAVGIE